jgi:uncharacterized membrane protein
MEPSPPSRAEEKETGRLEAFSDGVFAIAITLLILEVRVPREVEPGGLLPALLLEWPSYLAFVTSFATIGIMWVNHHRMFGLIRRADPALLLLNGLLLLGITFVPFPTALVAEYILHPDEPVAAVVYSGTMFVIAICFNLLWQYVARHPHLLHPAARQEAVAAITSAYRFGLLLYLVAAGLAWVSATASLLLNLALAVFFAWPRRE